jgi:hypothetical protein
MKPLNTLVALRGTYQEFLENSYGLSDDGRVLQVHRHQTNIHQTADYPPGQRMNTDNARRHTVCQRPLHETH